jgi:hypothetical protein
MRRLVDPITKAMNGNHMVKHDKNKITPNFLRIKTPPN